MAMDTVHNYYERLVFNEIKEHYADKIDDEDTLADMACIALNRIAPRYIRYDIDMSFYMSTVEHIEVENRVSKAVRKAYKRIKKADNIVD
jgi:phosphoenolpyruvate synthase/pyruvate phosphate dikinase